MAFPTSPNDGDFYNENGVTWLYVSPPGVWTKAGGSPITIQESDPVFLASPAALYTEAPIDGSPYARQDGTWVATTGGSYADADVDNHLNTGTATTGEYLSWNGSDYDWASVPPGYADADVDTHLNTSTATAGQVLSYTGSDYDWIDAGGGGGLAWELDTGPVGDPIQYAPAGDWLGVQSVGDGYVLGDKSSNASFTCSVSLFGGPTVTYPYNGGMVHYAAAKTVVYGRNEVGLATGNFNASLGIKDSDFVYHSGSTTPKFKCTRSGLVTINNAYTLPTADGTVGQVLTTDGAGASTWADAAGGGGGATGPLPTVLLKGDVAYDQDDSLNGYTFTTAGTTPTLNTTDKVFGASSINFPATSSRITTDQTVNFGTQPFCIETWLKPTGVANTEYFASKPASGDFCWLLITNGVPGINYGGAQRNATSSLSTSAWNHVAYVYDGTNIKIYFNGTEESSAVASSDLGDFLWTIGGSAAGVAAQASWYDGLMDDFRITVGDPVYTGNFTPAEHPIPVANPLGTDETDVTITSPANGEVLTYDGSNWVNAAAGGGGALAWEADTVFGGDVINYAPVGTWLGIQDDLNGYALGSKNDNRVSNASIRLFGGTARTYPYHGGMVHHGPAETMVYGRNSVALGVNGGQSLGLSDRFRYHDAGTTPRFEVSQSGVVKINNNYELPTTDGTVGQVLTTNGAGISTWADAGGGGGETLDSVTTAGATTTNAITVGNLTSTGIDDNATATAMTINSVGRVGVGTSDPQNAFVVSDGNDGLEFRTTLTDDNRITSYNRGTSAFTRMSLSASDFTFLLGAANTQALTLKSDGNFGIGTVAPATILNTNVASGPNEFRQSVGEQGVGQIISTTTDQFIVNLGSGSQSFYTTGAERLRISSTGTVRVGNQDLATSAGLSSTSLNLTPLNIWQRGTSATNNLALFHSNVGGSQVLKCAIRADGDVENTNNSYGGISDARVKSDIVDASPQLDDIMAVKVRSYTLDATGDTHIGVVAQELEEAGMGGLVKEDAEGMKSVKYSVLYMKAIKAIQEQQVMIEELKAEVAALKGV